MTEAEILRNLEKFRYDDAEGRIKFLRSLGFEQEEGTDYIGYDGYTGTYDGVVLYFTHPDSKLRITVDDYSDCLSLWTKGAGINYISALSLNHKSGSKCIGSINLTNNTPFSVVI